MFYHKLGTQLFFKSAFYYFTLPVFLGPQPVRKTNKQS